MNILERKGKRMTAIQIRTKIEYCEKMQEKHENLQAYFTTKLWELKEDLKRLPYLDFSQS